jgi:stalled ribosome rescue protein Dom34
MSYVHAIVWLDHLSARIFAFSDGDGETIPIESQSEQRQLHRKSGKPGSGHAPDDVALFGDIVAAVADVREILITGPGTAKLAFRRYVEQRHHELARRIVGVETIDHPSDGELAAYGRKYFRRVDQLGNY